MLEYGEMFFFNFLDDGAESELSVGQLSSTQPNPTQQLNDPTQPIGLRYQNEPPYIKQQLACEIN